MNISVLTQIQIFKGFNTILLVVDNGNPSNNSEMNIQAYKKLEWILCDFPLEEANKNPEILQIFKDSPDIISEIKTILKKGGYNISEYPNPHLYIICGKDVLKKFQENF